MPNSTLTSSMGVHAGVTEQDASSNSKCIYRPTYPQTAGKGEGPNAHLIEGKHKRGQHSGHQQLTLPYIDTGRLTSWSAASTLYNGTDTCQTCHSTSQPAQQRPWRAGSRDAFLQQAQLGLCLP